MNYSTIHFALAVKNTNTYIPQNRWELMKQGTVIS